MPNLPVSERQDRKATDRLTEAGLIALARQRDERAIRAIMRRHNQRLYRVARGVLRDDGEAEDALQEAYLRAFAALDDFRQESSLGTWLTRIVLNEAISRWRGRGPRLEQVTHLGADAPGARVVSFPHGEDVDPERAVAQRQIREALERAIDELPKNFRIVLTCRVIEEMSVEETAASLDLRPETVKTRLHRARRLLRAALEKEIGPVLTGAFPFAGQRCEQLTDRVLARLRTEKKNSGNL
ncbi:MAG: RNA polymerase sigma factor [Hyphomicrobiales bacterium]|nr:RNA polymerase sigma factor [Hyphomicrobiales bacterium]MBV9977743.1 RNA polymerase sigma factor [Hyphomicrobiales bacterium]